MLVPLLEKLEVNILGCRLASEEAGQGGCDEDDDGSGPIVNFVFGAMTPIPK